MARSDDRHLHDTESDDKENASPKGKTARDAADSSKPNPRRTTTDGWLTVPKFGSAGSGGAELEPGPERD
jgi:hypothetical protein